MKRIRRPAIIFLALTVALLTLAALGLRVPAVAAVVAALPIGPGPGPTPLPPTIAAPPGQLPSGLAGVKELAQYGEHDYQAVGCGFFLKLPTGAVIGVTTAHSIASLGQPGNDLQQVAFSLPGAANHLADFAVLYGTPGMAFSGADLSVDYVLLRAPGSFDPELGLDPDGRGAPQAGERVILFSGLGADQGRPPVLLGTVMSSEPTATWLLMDDSVDPSGMSGSPVVSAYTGRVVGMAVGATRQRGRVLIGLNPIGAIVRHALAANVFPSLSSYTR